MKSDNMINWIKEYYRKKLSRDFNRKRDSKFLNIKDISSVGFLFDINSAESVEKLQQVCAFFGKKKLEFRGLAIETAKNVFEREVVEKGSAPKIVVPQELELCGKIEIVPYEELSWIGVVKGEVAEEFFASKYDMAINLNPDGNFTLDHLFATYADSPVRAGMSNVRTMPYTIVLEGAGREILPVEEYLEQIFHYLGIIKTN